MKRRSPVSLSDEDHKRLNLLSLKAREAKDRYAKESVKLKSDMDHMRAYMVDLKKQATEARSAHVKAYKDAGLSRQMEWQRERTSQGQCRYCGNRALPNKNHCEFHQSQLQSNAGKALSAKQSKLVEQ